MSACLSKLSAVGVGINALWPLSVIFPDPCFLESRTQAGRFPGISNYCSNSYLNAFHHSTFKKLDARSFNIVGNSRKAFRIPTWSDATYLWPCHYEDNYRSADV